MGNNKDCKQDSSKGYTSDNNTDFALDNSNFDNTAPYMAAVVLVELYKVYWAEYLKAPYLALHLAQYLKASHSPAPSVNSASHSNLDRAYFPK
ncbi:hypothetical protein [Bacillus sp. UNC438CL73TsuS30]|uniref:hypothetical protein n=1 Tax=Bacillus sp. UNC438CL73TsuS30 TaxID=1340434 RepID=UPI00047C36DD|nr:hypothetical protein [Bacillus sp. UNC438CL73TsuS30]